MKTHTPTEKIHKDSRVSDENQSSGFSTILFKSSTSPDEVDFIVWTSLKQGNRKALDYIFEKYIRLLYAYGGKIWKDGAFIEDSIQDVFVELWNRREKLSATNNIKFYLLKSLRRRIVRKLSNEQRERMHLSRIFDYSDEIEFSIESDLIHNQNVFEQEEQLTKAMAQLSKRQREAVHLKFYQKLTYVQLSEVLEIDLKSSYKLIGKAIDSLRKLVRMVR